MKNKIKLNKNVDIDLPKLISGKLLVQANSGGGKSWLIRRIVEQAYGKVQIIILDPEGEFGTLREKFNFVLAGKDGDTPAEPRSAALLAERLLEHKVSTIVDLYELHPQERKRFVRLFLESMVNVPKKLYHPTLVILDEAHIFAPEKGEAESLSSVVGMASLGRKREFSLILATQRISKLHKDAAAECNNKLIGRASLDIDRKRAADELGITNKEEILALRTLKPGEFFGFGPAISDEVTKIKVGDVQTSIPKGGNQYKVLPPTDGIKKILGKLADLPEEAKKEATTIKEMKAEISSLHRHRCPKVGIDQGAVETAVKKAEMEKERQFAAERNGMIKSTNNYLKIIASIGKTVAPYLEDKIEVQHIKPAVPERISTKIIVPRFSPLSEEERNASSGETDLSNPQQRIINAIAWIESIGVEEPEQTAVAFLSGYKYGGGGFNNPKGALRALGFVEYIPGNKIKLTEEGMAVAKIPNEPLTTEDLHQKVLEVLETPHKRILSPLLESYPEAISNEDLAELSGYKFGSGGFNNPKGRLRSLGLIEYQSGGFVVARDILFV